MRSCHRRARSLPESGKMRAAFTGATSRLMDSLPGKASPNGHRAPRIVLRIPAVPAVRLTSLGPFSESLSDLTGDRELEVGQHDWGLAMPRRGTTSLDSTR